jgi:SOS-response transcriptional repressor LexA
LEKISYQTGMNRIRELRNERQWSAEKLAEMLGTTAPTIYRLETGSRQLTLPWINRLAEAFECDPGEIISGKFAKTQAFPPLNGQLSRVDLRPIPIISWISAGKMSEISDPYEAGDGEDFILGDASLGPSSFALRVEGESMLPRFKPGEVIICDPDAALKPGDFVVAKAQDEEAATFKKYRPRGTDPKGGEIFELAPLNEDYPTILCNENNPVTIIGKVVRRVEVL